MAKIKGWTKIKTRGLRTLDAWELDEGVELDSYGIKTKYPFIEVFFNSESWSVRRNGTHTSKDIGYFKTKALAISKAIKYMKSHPKG